MRSLLLTLLLLRGPLALANPTLEDNKLPTAEEILAHGQPEEVASLGLPSDEESFNHLSIFFDPSRVVGNGVGSGTYHFVSSTFPEVDARGFHEAVFDGIGDYFPSWPSTFKRDYGLQVTPSIAQRLGLRSHNNFRKRSDPTMETSRGRTKRNAKSRSYSQNLYPKKVNTDNKVTSSTSGQSYTHDVEKRETHNMEDNHSDKITTDSSENNYGQKSNAYSNFRNKRSGGRNVRGMEMGSFGFHGDVFNGDFGDFTTMRKRARGAQGFHGDTFSDGFGDFSTMKRSEKKKKFLSKVKDYWDMLTGGNSVTSADSDAEHLIDEDANNNKYLEESNFVSKRRPEMDSMGFHGDTFSRGFGEFEPFRKRVPKGSMGFYGDTFNQGFGDFDTLKKRRPEMDSMGFHGDTFSRGFGEFEPFKKRKPEIDSIGFHHDSFSRNSGNSDAFKKRRANSGSMGFYGDTFSQGFGDFDPLKKRRPEMDSMGFHGDTFSRGFGEFKPFRKRSPNRGAMGFHSDTFSQGFGDFDPLKKRRQEMNSMGFHGDTFSRGFGEFEPFRKRSPNSAAMGFHSDTFSQGFGDFDTFKKRMPEMDSTGFHGDTLSRGFSGLDMDKKRSVPIEGDLGKESAKLTPEDKACCTDSSMQRHQGVQ